MAKSQNDKVILGLKAEISEKKKNLNKINKFSPITNCSLELFNNRYNINTLDKNQLLLLIAQLQGLKKSLSEVYPTEKLVISSFDINDWLSDLKSKFDILNIKIEEDRLKLLETKLHNLLSIDTKVGIEIDDIKKMI